MEYIAEFQVRSNYIATKDPFAYYSLIEYIMHHAMIIKMNKNIKFRSFGKIISNFSVRVYAYMCECV